MAQEQTRPAPDGRGKADGRVPPRPRPPGPEQARGTAKTGTGPGDDQLDRPGIPRRAAYLREPILERRPGGVQVVGWAHIDLDNTGRAENRRESASR